MQDRQNSEAISFPELRSPWHAVGKRKLWEHPFWNNNGNSRILVIRLTAQSQSASMACYGACLKWMLPELSFSDGWSRGTKLWERNWVGRWREMVRTRHAWCQVGLPWAIFLVCISGPILLAAKQTFHSRNRKSSFLSFVLSAEQFCTTSLCEGRKNLSRELHRSVFTLNRNRFGSPCFRTQCFF